MNKTRLVFKSISEIVGGNGMAVIILTDQEEKRAISLVCDNVMKSQIGLRSAANGIVPSLLPEVMLSLLKDVTDVGRYEINIHSIIDGEYRTTIMNLDTLDLHKIRLSDAVLLSIISRIPIFIDDQLMYRQSSAYDGRTDRMSIPINTLDKASLEEELRKAVHTEDYRLASQIKDELKRREKENE